MEWMHCHIARLPVAPKVRVNEIPEPISAIVMKLLAKSAEERYQTAVGAAGGPSTLPDCFGNPWEDRSVSAGHSRCLRPIE